MTLKKTTKAPKKAAPKKRVKLGTSSAAERKRAFADAYIANGRNALQAAITAGYSAKTAGSQASRLLLKDDEVKRIVAERSAELATAHRLTTDSVIAELSKIVHADVRNLYRADGRLKLPHEWDDETAAAVAGVDVVESMNGTGDDAILMATKKVRLWDKGAAIDKAMKHLGLFELDNKQKNPLDDVPRDVLQQIVAHLSGR